MGGYVYNAAVVRRYCPLDTWSPKNVRGRKFSFRSEALCGYLWSTIWPVPTRSAHWESPSPRALLLHARKSLFETAPSRLTTSPFTRTPFPLPFSPSVLTPPLQMFESGNEDTHNSSSRRVGVGGLGVSASSSSSSGKKKSEAKCAAGVIENVCLLGAAVGASTSRWERVARIVHGRIINGYSRSDYILGLLFRAKSLSLSVAGVQKVCRETIKLLVYCSVYEWAIIPLPLVSFSWGTVVADCFVGKVLT